MNSHVVWSLRSLWLYEYPPKRGVTTETSRVKPALSGRGGHSEDMSITDKPHPSRWQSHIVNEVGVMRASGDVFVF